jgi:uncharacterized protein YxjI
MHQPFFDSNSYFVDEKVNFLKFENVYQVYGDTGQKIGAVKQKLTGGQKLLRLVLNKAMLPFLLEIKDNNDQVQASISRGWTFFMSRIIISDSQGNKIAGIKQKFRFFKPTFIISDTSENVVATITGDWKAWNFVIKDPAEQQVGAITKKWAGALKEVFTTADKYNVTLDAAYPNKQHKAAVLAAAITIDMVLKERK